MSRARNIKPGFFKNDLLAECNPLARILFCGLWCVADREGRLEDRPKRIKADCLPYDECDCDALLGELAERGFIVRYTVSEARYIAIPEFAKHQNPHCKEQASSIPAPCMHGASTVQATDKHGEGTEVAVLIPDSLIPDSLQELSNLPDGRLDVAANADDLPSGDTDESKGAKDAAQPASRCPLSQIVALYHELLPMCRAVEKLTDARAGYIRQRWREDLPTLEAWRNYFTDVSRSPFLTGRAPGRDGKPPFVADLEWLTRPGNFAKVAEGRYHR
ncbi:hypothetical protein [Frateuria terrea]|uniref:Uncharacterized protein n=1 Tax=Frateuria terrea TaxID=529704 RepID=A0A1H6ZUM5_9GAMM|nr:hypothetical protein [Frateuria terrea]SEJ55297.1 hypothetical protein SAMN04487997_0192 [Frateuria terrea]SFP47270.1 hypothetical protein SAMN02927913_2198 [Frateuria terrea]